MSQLQRTLRQRGPRARLSASIAAVLAACFLAPTAGAFEIETGNPDLKVRLDTQLRYVLGFRGEGINPAFGNSPTYDETEYRFGRGDVMTNRLDALMEFDVGYKNMFGARVSGAAWYDNAYRSGKAVTNPGIYNSSFIIPPGAPGAGTAVPVSIPFNQIGSYVDNVYTSTTDRFYAGPSGEILDAFVFANFDLGGMQANAKLGQHTVYWGEAFFTAFHGIAYSQAPLDGQKGASSPGIEAKEVFMPINQLSAAVQLSSEWSLRGQYFFDWQANRLPQGGSYFGSADMLFNGPQRLFASLVPGAFFGSPTDVPVFIPQGPALTPTSKSGNWGLNLRYSPAQLGDTTFGLYYRKFDETQPWPLVFKLTPGQALPADYHQSYAQDTQMFAGSMQTALGPVSMGLDLVYRKNTALNSSTAFASSNGSVLDFAGKEGARGNTMHLVANGVYLLPRTPLWESGTLIGELVYSRLLDVTKNEDLFNGVGYRACATGSKDTGCSTKDVLLMQVNVTPQWLQVFPGVDLSAPMSIAYGLHGNGATLGGGSEGSATWSLGLQADVQQKYYFGIKWNDSYARYNTANGVVTTTSGNAAQNNHGWLALTFKTTF